MGMKRSEARMRWMKGKANGNEVVRDEVKRGVSTMTLL
jgi:hypothetical protein